MAELVDAPDSKSSGSNTVWVQVPLRPPIKAIGVIRFFDSPIAEMSIIYPNQILRHSDRNAR